MPLKPQTARRIAQYSSIIFVLPSCLMIGFFGGQWLDKKWDTEPVFSLILLLLGAVAGFYQVFRMLLEEK